MSEHKPVLTGYDNESTMNVLVQLAVTESVREQLTFESISTSSEHLEPKRIGSTVLSTPPSPRHTHSSKVDERACL